MNGPAHLMCLMPPGPLRTPLDDALDWLIGYSSSPEQDAEEFLAAYLYESQPRDLTEIFPA